MTRPSVHARWSLSLRDSTGHRCLCLGVLAVVLFLSPACSRERAPATGNHRVEVRLVPGMSVRAIAETLRARRVVSRPLDFRFLAWFEGSGPRIRPGRYRLSTGSGARQTLKVLTHAEPALLMVTIPEGLTAQQTALILAGSGICDSTEFLWACSDTVVLRSFAISAPTAEGYLFPETYELSTAMSPEDVVRLLLRQFRTVMAELKPQATTKMTDHEFVALASIIEKEARVDSEYALIAGVFVNRLRHCLPLQSCATVQYVLPERKERLDVADTKVQSPYNTYLHTGLPPGPICNPGRKSLAAALYPARTDYLYFVARGDGSHIFSRTLAEHEAALHRAPRAAQHAVPRRTDRRVSRPDVSRRD